MTDDRLAELEALAEKATPGPWVAVGEKQDNPLTGDYDGCRSYGIVAANADVEGLGPAEWPIVSLGPCGGCEGPCSRKASLARPLASLRPNQDIGDLTDACYPSLNTAANAAFLAAARDAVPELLAENRRLKAELAGAVAAERERCAKLVEDYGDESDESLGIPTWQFEEKYGVKGDYTLADAIRAGG